MNTRVCKYKKIFNIKALFLVVTIVVSILGALAKATISFVMYFRPSVSQSAWNMSAPTRRIFMKFDI
jgi:hypothetical protein